MRYLENVKNKLSWEKYYAPEFDWGDWQFYLKYYLTDEFIEEFKDKLNWLHLLTYQRVNEALLEKYIQYIDWTAATAHQQLSEKFMDKYTDEITKHLCWCIISTHQKLSEEFIKKHKNSLDWFLICKHQHLSEDFISKHTGKVNWNNVSRYQTLSEGFIKKYMKQLNISKILIHNELTDIPKAKLSESFTKELFKKLDPIQIGKVKDVIGHAQIIASDSQQYYNTMNSRKIRV